MLEIKIRPIFAWYDFWVGFFCDRTKKRLYCFPLPTLGFYVEWRKSDPFACCYFCREYGDTPYRDGGKFYHIEGVDHLGEPYVRVCAASEIRARMEVK